MKFHLTLIAFFFGSLQLVAQNASTYIHVDQFGYLRNAEKVAVISDPLIGFNSSGSFTPSAVTEVFDISNNTVVFTGTAVPWESGSTHTESGDRGWWFDFSSVTTSGQYVIRNNGEVSPPFNIGDEVYSDLMKDAGRMFYYNRCNSAKAAPHAQANWMDGLDFMNAQQDANCRFIDDPSNSALEKDLTGGWYDAGDYNKYVTFACLAVHNLLMAYEENPQAFGDDWNIPESGNGIPDILDEVKWELDWLIKMNNADGSTHIKMGSQNYSENNSSPPTANTDPRFYGPTCSSASIRIAAVFAQAASVYSTQAGMAAFVQDLETRAIASYDHWFTFFITNTIETNCDDGSIVSGDADMDIEDQMDAAVAAASYLFRLTGTGSYSSFIQSVHLGTDQVNGPYWGVYKMLGNDALLAYTALSTANGIVSSNITNAVSNAASDNWSEYFGFNGEGDLYRGFMPSWSYHWGSNMPKALYACLNIALVKNGINLSNSPTYERAGAEMLHYFHGVNPLGLVYLSNMGHLGATRSCNEIYHTWFNDGSDWDNAQTSLYGPPPGYVPGGANSSTSVSSLTPPYGQPALKSYLDFNTGWPDNSWEVSEPAIYYQAAYIRLLASFVDTSVVTSIESPAPSFSNISQYPNPSTGAITVVGLERGQELSIFDISGRSVFQQRVLRFAEHLDLSRLSKGSYTLIVTERTGSLLHSAQLILE